MPSSTSSSETIASQDAGDRQQWRRFFRIAVATAIGLGTAIYAFVATIDPWDILQLSPAWRRAPISSNQRFSYAALARSQRYDSVVIGTSTSRLLRPAALNASFGGNFVNLSMNAATPYEQSRLLATFAAAHPRLRAVVLGLNFFQWCTTTSNIPKYMAQTFPEWMYDANRWDGYAHIFSLYALQESLAQLAYLVGLRSPRFGFDGYANFLPDDSRYDAARVAPSLGTLLPRGQVADDLHDRADLRFEALETMRAMLSGLPHDSLKVVFFAPVYLGNRPAPGSAGATSLGVCKARIVEMTKGVANTRVVDFLIDSPISRDASNYWDPMHYRIGIADKLAADLAAAIEGQDAQSQDYRLLR